MKMNPHRKTINDKIVFKGFLIRIKNNRRIWSKEQLTVSKMENNIIVWVLDNHFRGSAFKTSRWLWMRSINK